MKEAHNIRQLRDGDLGIDMRWILQIHARTVEQCRHLLFARDQRAQTLIGRCEFALHQRERSIRAGTGVIIRVLLPRSNRFQRQQLRANGCQYHLAVGPLNKIRCGSVGMNCFNPSLKDLKRRNLSVDILARVILQLCIELVVAGQCSLRRLIAQVDLIEILVRNPRELLLPGLFRGAGGQGLQHTNSNR